MALENLIDRLNSQNENETITPSRMVALRNRIVEILSLGIEQGQFCESDFSVSASWFPVSDYSEIATNGGKVFVLGRPESSDAETRNANAVVKENVRIQIAVIFASASESELTNERIELHALLCEQIADKLRTAGDELGYQWAGTDSLRTESGAPFHFMEMAEGAFVWIADARYFKYSTFVQ